MRTLFILLAATTALAQTTPQTRLSRITENLRGVSAVTQKIAWASGTHGTYLRTTDGHIWIPDHVPGAESLDFRGIVAFSSEEAFLMSSGPGDQSRIYHTTDAGRHWQLQFTNTNEKGFFDSMVFWDRTHGIVLGDPIPDETGTPKFELLMTDDGQTWTPIPPAQLPPALEGEAAFAASNTCLAILAEGEGHDFSRAVSVPKKNGASAAEGPDSNIWFVTGGKAARVFHSPDRGLTWEVLDTPIAHGPDSAGIFSIAFRDATHGVIAGGDYKLPEQDGPNLAFTTDGGKTWTLSKIFPQSYYSAVAYDRNTRRNNRDEALDRIFLVGPKFIYDFRPPQNPTRISANKKSDSQFNAVSPYPQGGALVVGPKGVIINVP
ncbi:MAG: WD40/YVTN/BNR-like repeat-containing protein [Candidatus Sulfotelmatobacter sp.]